MVVVTNSQMKQIEENSLKYSMSMKRLMENAGSAAAMFIRRTMEVDGKFCTVFCGRGNNGGDGLVVARKLYESGANVVVVLTDGDPATDQAKEMMELIAPMDVALVYYEKEDPAYLKERLEATDIIVDAIYGTGFHGQLDEKHRKICELINGTTAQVIALDVPSGVTCDTGFADEYAVIADMTIAFDSYKPLHVLPVSVGYCGEIKTADIGIPPQAHEGIEGQFILVDNEFVFSRLPKRRRDSHKGSYGKLLNIAGSQKYMGAAILSTMAAMRAGAGYVTLASTKEVCRTALPSLLEAVMLPLKQGKEGHISYESLPEILEALENSTALLIGNGLDVTQDTCRLVYEVLKNAKCPVIVDGDGINVISRNIDILKQTNCNIVLTPHMKELSRLTTLPIEQLKQDRYTIGANFAREYGCTVVMKDAYTATAGADGRMYINTTGNAGMAKAGSGDVLAGIIGGLAAQGIDLVTAAAAGAYLHGLAGNYAACKYSQYGMLPREIIDQLPKVFLHNDR
ncbi:NAD(P)H-hydrate dehydratase [Youxingia wuxianensis]|uniref:Bifunctional NAD(P)H-hydrate repair enzyme n=1 Tax=Youxingia wuxianensis TaxID=2763678 RepID=A0A926IHB8_9FIRM|nr:NAD(P)H-hydrate dehydratase [Youxingia wuxianensis]MBC8584970.1 NAD(P)H-hydrate dehydratase [Youxingia wuxianensis]